MTRTYRNWTIAALFLVGLTLIAVASAPALAGGCCPSKAPKADAAKVVNARCPIMGGKLDRDKVPASLTRTFASQKVGFCCGGCLPKWDKLSDDEKAAKLKAAM